MIGHVTNSTGGTNVYRFGRTAKTINVSMYAEKERKKVFIEKLGAPFGGLNRPHSVIIWEKVNDIEMCWEILKDYLRGNITLETIERPKFVQEMSLGDNYFSAGDPRAPDVPAANQSEHNSRFGAKVRELLQQATKKLFSEYM